LADPEIDVEARATVDALWEPVRQARALAQRPDDPVGDAQVVAHQVELRLAALREVDALGARDADGPLADLEVDGDTAVGLIVVHPPCLFDHRPPTGRRRGRRLMAGRRRSGSRRMP
jgi:hypothetical protein